MGEWALVFLLYSYTSDSGVARILSTGGGGGQNGNFCTLNAFFFIRGRLWHRPIPYSSFFNSSIPCAPVRPVATPVNNMQQRTRRRRGGRRVCMRNCVYQDYVRPEVLGELGARWRQPPMRDRLMYD